MIVKKVLSVILSALIVTVGLSFSVSAAQQEEVFLNADAIVVSETIETLPNGLTVIDTVVEYLPSSIQLAATTYTKSGSRTVTLTNGSSTLFTFTVNGTFSVNPGVSATCTSVSSSHTIGSGSDWKFDYATTSKSGNQAIGDGYFYRKILFVTVDTYTAHAVLSCDANGNLY